MTATLRERDPGLQLERTALSWQRTAFSSLVLALVTVRSGYHQGSLLLTSLGCASVIFATMMIVLSRWRQNAIVLNRPPLSRTSRCAKRLICLSLFLNALAVVIQGVLSLY